MTGDSHRCWRSLGISCGKTEQIDGDIFRVTQWERLLDDLCKDCGKALHKEGTNRVKIGVFFERCFRAEKCPLCWRAIKKVAALEFCAKMVV